MSVALKFGKLVKQTYPNIKVVYTRDKDVFIGLKERSSFAKKQKADLFVSIHANALDIKKNPSGKHVKGITTFVLGANASNHNLQVAMKENSAIHYEDDYSVKYEGFDPSDPISYIMGNMLQDMHQDKSLNLASLVQKSMAVSTSRVNRGIQQGPFWVLNDAAMPAVLLEVGFISNLDEERYMMTSTGQTKIAQGIFKGFQAYKATVEKDIVKPKSVVALQKDVTSSKVAMNAPMYAIQISSAQEKVKEYSKLYTKQKVSEIYTSGRYRYYVAASSDLGQVQRDAQVVRRTVKDCFIIAIYKGNLISVSEAKKLERK